MLTQTKCALLTNNSSKLCSKYVYVTIHYIILITYKYSISLYHEVPWSIPNSTIPNLSSLRFPPGTPHGTAGTILSVSAIGTGDAAEAGEALVMGRRWPQRLQKRAVGT